MNKQFVGAMQHYLSVKPDLSHSQVIIG